MKITSVTGHEVFDSRGYPTIECKIVLDDGFSVRASVPSGRSRGSHEAVELRDGGKRLRGMGVKRAIEHLETVIAPALIGKEPDVVEMDLHMIGLDGTADKSNLGANTILAASIAILQAQALGTQTVVYELIAELCDLEQISLPFPQCNLINGGLHAENNLQFQEIMVTPIGFPTFREAFESTLELNFRLRDVLKKRKKQLIIGDEGGFACNFSDDIEALDLLTETIEAYMSDEERRFVIALDCAASHFYNNTQNAYNWHGEQLTASQMIDLYDKLVETYPIYSIEDGLSEDDWEGWCAMTEKMGETVQIVGDDIFATNPERIAKGIGERAANAAVIKPNQIGTVTETLQAIRLCKDNNITTVVSHRSGETDDNFIVDLAVGTCSGQIKIGGFARGERINKYNQALRIEDDLHFDLLNK